MKQQRFIPYLVLIVLCVMTGSLVVPGYATSISTFTSSAAFLAALGTTPSSTETYEGFLPGTVITTGSTFNGITYDSFPASILGGLIGNLFSRLDAQSLEAERDGLPGSGPPDFFFPGESFSVTFSTPVTAVGIFFNARSDAILTDYVFIHTPVGDVSTGGSTPDIGPLFFAGIISNTPFTTATFGAVSNAPSGFNVDNLIRASAVPEPSTWILLTSGLVSLAVLRRRLVARHG